MIGEGAAKAKRIQDDGDFESEVVLKRKVSIQKKKSDDQVAITTTAIPSQY